MDRIDKKILALLQENAEYSVSDIAEKVGLSTTPCWRRIQNMEKDGVIKGRVAILDAEKLNVGVTVFVAIKTNQHTTPTCARNSTSTARTSSSQTSPSWWRELPCRVTGWCCV